MSENNHHAPSLGTFARKLYSTGVGALENRGELLMVELQEEKARAISLIIRGIGALFLGIMTLLLLTGTVIFLIPEEFRVYAAGAFCFLYLVGTLAALWSLKLLLKRMPFSESLAQLRKDRELFDAFK